VGHDRIIGAVVATASQVVEPGKVLRSISGSHFIGFIGTTVNKFRLEQVKTLLEYDLPVIISNNIYEALYSKLVMNAAISGLGALSGLTVGEILEEKHNRQLFLQVVTEVVNIANKLQQTLIQIGPIHLPDLALQPDDTTKMIDEKYQKLVTSLSILKDVKSSTLRSLEQGQPSEIDYLNGFVVRKGEELNIHTPANSRITEMVKEIESDSRTITPKNLFELKEILEK
jgi:2-dehydropantoate 2-reductase